MCGNFIKVVLNGQFSKANEINANIFQGSIPNLIHHTFTTQSIYMLMIPQFTEAPPKMQDVQSHTPDPSADQALTPQWGVKKTGLQNFFTSKTKLVVQTFIAKTFHVISTKLNHSHFLCISFIRKFYFNHFFLRTVSICVEQTCAHSMDTTIFT